MPPKPSRALETAHQFEIQKATLILRTSPTNQALLERISDQMETVSKQRNIVDEQLQAQVQNLTAEVSGLKAELEAKSASLQQETTENSDLRKQQSSELVRTKSTPSPPKSPT